MTRAAEDTGILFQEYSLERYFNSSLKRKQTKNLFYKDKIPNSKMQKDDQIFTQKSGKWEALFPFRRRNFSSICQISEFHQISTHKCFQQTTATKTQIGSLIGSIVIFFFIGSCYKIICIILKGKKGLICFFLPFLLSWQEIQFLLLVWSQFWNTPWCCRIETI